MLPMNKAKWRCGNCRASRAPRSTPEASPQPAADNTEPSASTTLRDTSPPPSIVNIDTQALMDFIDSKLDSMWREQRAASAVLQDKLDALSASWSAHDARLVAVEERVASLARENCELRDELEDLRRRQDDAEQRSRRCNLDIHNVPEKSGENLAAVVESIGALIGVPLSGASVVDVHRVQRGRASPASRPRNIVVQLASRRLRDQVIAAARARRTLSTEQLGLGAPAARFFINEHLTLRNKVLYAKTRELARQKKYKFVWVRDGGIMVRKSEQTHAVAVRSEADLAKL